MGSQNTIVSTNLPSFPWSVGDKLDAIPLNNAFITQQNLITSLSNAVALIQFNNAGGSSFGNSVTMNWGGGNPTTPGTYILTGYAPYQFTLGTLYYSAGDNGGSFTATVEISGVPVDGFTNIAVNNATVQSVMSSGNNSVYLGGELQVVISNVVGQPMDGFLTLNSLPPVVVPVFGVMIGLAYGTSTAIGVGQNQLSTVGASSGTSTAVGVGMVLVQGQSIGLAAGTSTAVGVSGSTTTAPVFVLNQGALDVNPLG